VDGRRGGRRFIAELPIVHNTENVMRDEGKTNDQPGAADRAVVTSPVTSCTKTFDGPGNDEEVRLG